MPGDAPRQPLVFAERSTNAAPQRRLASIMKEISVEDIRPSRTTSYFTIGRTGRPCTDKHRQRRVTFDLPPYDGADGTSPGGSTAVGSVAQVAGVNNWLRSRRIQSREASPPLRRSIAHHFGSQVAHETAGYQKGTLPDAYRFHRTALHRKPSSITSSTTASELGLSLLKACRDGEEDVVLQLLRKASMVGAADLNVTDHTGRTALSYLASSGSVSMLEPLATLPGVDANIADTEGNTPLHFAAQAGHSDVLNILLSRCSAVDVDARNALGFTPLMKAALQGRTKCAKILLIAGASPTLKDSGRGFRAEQWARFCGRYVCAEAIEKLSRSHLLERSGTNGRWGSEPALGEAAFIRPHQELAQRQSAGGNIAGGSSSWLRSKIRRAFRSSTASVAISESPSIVTQQLTSAALCASSPVLPPAPPKFLLRGASSVPKLHVTPAGSKVDIPREQRPSVGYRVAAGGPKKKKK